MKKLKFNSTLNHKQSDYQTREIIVEKVITLYGRSFSELKDHPLRDDPYIAENRDLMYIDSNDVAHCLLMVDYDSGDGILVESEGSSYARKSQFIPNAKSLIVNNELTASERKLHNSLKKMVDQISELAHCGENSFVFDELLDKSDLDLKSLLRDSVTAMLQEREDIQMAESHSIDVDFQPNITVEAKPTQELTLYLFISDLTMIPVSYIRTKFPRYKKARICQYTREGREEIHKTLKFDEDVIKTMHLLAKAKTYGRSIEYMDNRISLYAAQYGKCAVTGEILWIDEIHCHHKKPISQNGTDEYKNLVIVRDDVHKLIHATRQETIIAYLNVLNLNKSQLQKLNKLRIMAGNPAI